MKKFKLLFSIGFFFICLNAYSQIGNKQEQLEKVKTYITYKIINNYLDQATNQSEYKTFRNEYEKNKPFLTKNPINEKGSYDELKNLLNRSFLKFSLEDVLQISNINLEELSKKNNEVAVKEITDKIIAKINTHYSPRIIIKNEDIDKIKKDALTEYNKMSNGSSQNLEEVDRQPPNNDKKDLQTTSENVNTNIDKTKNNVQNMESHEQAEFFSMNGLNLWNLISLLISIFTLFIVFLTKNNRSKSTTVQEAPKQTEKIQQTTHISTIGMEDFEKYLQRSSKIGEICKDIIILKNKPEPIESNTAINVEVREPELVNENIIHSENVFYMIQPIDDTYFSKSNMQQSKMGTVYKFIINNNNKNDATFEVISDGVDPNEIAKRNQNIIKPACNEDNIPGSIVRKIITLKLGHVSLEGDKWIIKTKALIKYE